MCSRGGPHASTNCSNPSAGDAPRSADKAGPGGGVAAPANPPPSSGDLPLPSPRLSAGEVRGDSVAPGCNTTAASVAPGCNTECSSGATLADTLVSPVGDTLE